MIDNVLFANMAVYQQVLVLVAVASMILAGCTGGGGDDPVDENETDPAQADNLEDADGAVNNSTVDETNESESDNDGNNETNSTDDNATAASGGSQTAGENGNETTTQLGDGNESTNETSDASESDDSDSDREETHRITVNLIDSETGEPISGIGTVNGDSVYAGLSAPIRDGTYVIGGHAPEYEPAEKKVVTIDGEDEEVTLYLTPKDADTGDDSNDSDEADERHTLVVTVLDHEFNRVEGADVHAVTPDDGEDIANATTDEHGQATIDLKNGSYEIQVSHDDYQQPSDTRLAEIDGDPVAFPIQVRPSNESTTGNDSDAANDEDTRGTD